MIKLKKLALKTYNKQRKHYFLSDIDYWWMLKDHRLVVEIVTGMAEKHTSFLRMLESATPIIHVSHELLKSSLEIIIAPEVPESKHKKK